MIFIFSHFYFAFHEARAQKRKKNGKKKTDTPRPTRAKSTSWEEADKAQTGKEIKKPGKLHAYTRFFSVPLRSFVGVFLFFFNNKGQKRQQN